MTTVRCPRCGEIAALPLYEPIADWCRRSGMGTTATYAAIGRGDLRAIKLGKRTLIAVLSGAAWLASRPEPDITTGSPAPKSENRVAPPSQAKPRAARPGATPSTSGP